MTHNSLALASPVINQAQAPISALAPINPTNKLPIVGIMSRCIDASVGGEHNGCCLAVITVIKGVRL